jgi:membrane associated rhomboid family serine protease
MTSITLPIVLVSSIVSMIAFNRPDIMSRYQFNPYMIAHRNQWDRFITHAFLHADWLHLIINMLVLYSFGGAVERRFYYYFDEKGVFVFAAMYLGAIIASSITTFRKNKENHWYNAVGASGAVSAVLFSYVVFDPFGTILLYGILPLPAVVWALLYVFYSAYMGRRGGDNINHEAHLWGGFFGMVYTLFINPEIATDFMAIIAARFR